MCFLMFINELYVGDYCVHLWLFYIFSLIDFPPFMAHDIINGTYFKQHEHLYSKFTL